MSEMGLSRHFGDRQATSDLPRLADVVGSVGSCHRKSRVAKKRDELSSFHLPHGDHALCGN
jgi:hypothetical protein